MRAEQTSGKSTLAACTCETGLSALRSQHDIKCLALLVLEAVGDQLALAHVEQPVQLPPAVLPAVEGCEPAQLQVEQIKIVLVL